MLLIRNRLGGPFLPDPAIHNYLYMKNKNQSANSLAEQFFVTKKIH
jgi:hypothetical protein